MSTMKDTTLRCLRVLRMIPRYPAFITTENLTVKLNGIGYRITRRTIQRDLIKLSEIFPIFCVDEDIREKQWAWSDDIGLFDLPNMSPLTEKQRLSREPDGRIRLQATVTDTHELRWWLQGFGSMVEVKAPANLREVFKQNALETARRYADP
jgi:predicted DNA-binding transcriptional regulator YafY